MLCKIYFLCIFNLVLVKCVMDSLEIKFIIKYNDNNSISCDHTLDKIKQNKYTALEGGQIVLKTEYKFLINHFSCTELHDVNKVFISDGPLRSRSHITVTKEMGAVWSCRILANKDNPLIRSTVKVDDHTYAVAYCYVQVHVRRKKSPQTILVNNMVVNQVRTDLSEKEVDYTVAYEYADGDIVNVTCAAFDEVWQINMQYHFAGNNNSLQSTSYVGISTKLHSGHNNTYMTCLLRENEDEFLVKITLIMRSKFENIISLKINGLMLRPKVKKNNHYNVKYLSVPYQRVYMMCHVELADVKLSIEETKIDKNRNQLKHDYSNDSTQTVNFKSDRNYPVRIKCLSDFKISNKCAEITEINFTEESGFEDVCPLHIDLPPNGIVMELYESIKRRVIYYEFEEGEELTLNCYTSGCISVHSLQFSTHNFTKLDKNNITITLHPSGGLVEKCYVMEKDLPNSETPDRVYRELEVIFYPKVITTTTSTTPAPLPPEISTTQFPSSPTNMDNKVSPDGFGNNKILIAVGGVTAIVVIVVAYMICKMIKRSPQRAPHERNYENFHNQSIDSIPAHTVQWESNYAVPMDQRRENETYSVPVKPDSNMYATPIPKSQRMRASTGESTYASLDMKPGPSGRRNVFKDIKDSTYSEVCNKLEECYANVLPKSKRNVHEERTYANIAKESPYVNADNEPEPMYCDPNAGLKSQKGQYVNVNNAVYANRPGQEYVEPTYCEPNKRK